MFNESFRKKPTRHRIQKAEVTSSHLVMASRRFLSNAWKVGLSHAIGQNALKAKLYRRRLFSKIGFEPIITRGSGWSHSVAESH